ncbi:MAG: class I SAM-dependent methyltransferase [Saprospiraceae bacterium]|nr:class I SAM-dependent methyltransferase [Saprospiraceae bacterium]
MCGDKNNEAYGDEEVVQVDLMNLKFKTNTFDLVICNHVLEHIDDDHKAIQEVYRVLKHNGKAILQVPICYNMKETYENDLIVTENERLLHFGQKDHVRIYGNDYFKRLERVGFEIDLINIAAQFPNFGLNPKENLVIGIKHT